MASRKSVSRRGRTRTRGRSRGGGLSKPVKLSAELADIVGKKEAPRTEVTKKIWEYIKRKNLNDGRVIKPDEKLRKVVPVASLDMLKLQGHLSKHIKK